MELKEKLRGSSLGTLMPQSGQAMEELSRGSRLSSRVTGSWRPMRTRPLAMARAW